jgi:hypothetical protein
MIGARAMLIGLSACGRIDFANVTAGSDSGPVGDAAPFGLLAHTLGVSTGGVAGSVADTPAIDTTGASLLVACVSTYDFTITTALVSDSYANLWQPLPMQSGNANNLELYYVVAPSAGPSHVFHGTGGDGYPTLAILAFTGTVTTSAVLDGQSGSTPATTTTVQPGSITPTQAKDVFVACVGADSHTNWTSVTITNGFTITDMQLIGALTSPEEIGFAYAVDSTTTTVNPTWMVTGSDHGLNAAMAAFQQP